GGAMKDYRLRIGMRFVQQGHEFVIEGPLPNDHLKIKDTFTDVCSARPTAGLLEDLFAGRLELIGAGKEGQSSNGSANRSTMNVGRGGSLATAGAAFMRGPERRCANWFQLSRPEATARRNTPAAWSRPLPPKISKKPKKWRRKLDSK